MKIIIVQGSKHVAAYLKRTEPAKVTRPAPRHRHQSRYRFSTSGNRNLFARFSAVNQIRKRGFWVAYQETGQHVTHAEADRWMVGLETGNDTKPPECHD